MFSFWPGEQVSRAGQLSAHGEVLDFRFRDMGSFSIATAKREFLCCAGEFARELFV